MQTFKNAEPKTKAIAIILGTLSICCSCWLAISTATDPAANPQPTADVTKIYIQAFETIQAQQPTRTATIPPPTSTSTLEPTITTSALEASPTQPPQSTATSAAANQPAACIKDPNPQTGTVVDIVDGDTIKVMLDGLTYNLRYIGIDTPENTTKKEFYGQEATNRNAELVYGQTVTLYSDISDTDRYGRLLRYVFVNDQFVNLILVQEGFASAYRYEPDTACAAVFAQAETQPRVNQVGMWSAPPTVAPLPLATQPAGGSAVCSCSGNIYNCKDFATRSSAQACFDYCKSLGLGDIHKLDGDANGQACESLP